MINKIELYYAIEIAIVSCTLSTLSYNISIMSKRRQQYVHCSSAAKQATKTWSSIITRNYISEFAFRRDSIEYRSCEIIFFT